MYHCGICGRNFKKEGSHRIWHEGNVVAPNKGRAYPPGGYTCPICGKSFRVAGRHPLVHTASGSVPANKGGHHSSEAKAKMKAAAQIRWRYDVAAFKGRHHTAGSKEKMRLAHLGKTHITPQATRDALSRAKKGVPRPPHCQELLRQYNRQILADPVRSQRRQELAMAGCKRRPTSLERTFISMCAKYSLPYRFVGDGQIWINKLNPDFINTNGQKQLVEVLGRYWHTDDEVAGRVAHYARYGFSCVTLWEEELKDEASVLEKLGGRHDC